jgi:predicted NUDIX family NTP pyrophosphohydrolase
MSQGVRSAGLLPYRFRDSLEVLIAHPGGPFFAGKDQGAWSLVKGIVEPEEDEREAAAREFTEETGWEVTTDGWVSLGEITMRSRKVVIAWGMRRDFDLETFRPGTFVLHGREYPEIDRVAWMDPGAARRKLNPALEAFIDRLEQHVSLNGSDSND